MCLIAWNWQPKSEMPLLLLANRDEFYARPALPLHWWEDGRVLAGRDLQGSGTWLGVDAAGRMAALTNYRTVSQDPEPRPSRGALVTDFLQNDMGASDYLTALAKRSDHYNPFNLLVFDGEHLMGLESRHQRVLSLSPGMGGVSNADFDTPWPKLQKLKQGLHKQIQTGSTAVTDLLPLLQDRCIASDAELPQTGVPHALERVLSATFVASENYGTRACSVLALYQTSCLFFEQSHGAGGLLSVTQQRFTPSKISSDR